MPATSIESEYLDIVEDWGKTHPEATDEEFYQERLRIIREDIKLECRLDKDKNTPLFAVEKLLAIHSMTIESSLEIAAKNKQVHRLLRKWKFGHRDRDGNPCPFTTLKAIEEDAILFDISTRIAYHILEVIGRSESRYVDATTEYEFRFKNKSEKPNSADRTFDYHLSRNVDYYVWYLAQKYIKTYRGGDGSMTVAHYSMYDLIRIFCDMPAGTDGSAAIKRKFDYLVKLSGSNATLSEAWKKMQELSYMEASCLELPRNQTGKLLCTMESFVHGILPFLASDMSKEIVWARDNLDILIAKKIQPHKPTTKRLLPYLDLEGGEDLSDTDSSNGGTIIEEIMDGDEQQRMMTTANDVFSSPTKPIVNKLPSCAELIRRQNKVVESKEEADGSDSDRRELVAADKVAATTLLQLQKSEGTTPESFEAVVSAFFAKVEEKIILGYYTKQGVFYQLNELTAIVYHTLTPDQITDRWRKPKHNVALVEQLLKKGVLYQLGRYKYIQLPHFLMYCLDYAEERQVIGRSWKSRMSHVQKTMAEMEAIFPVVHVMLNDRQVAVSDVDAFTAENVARNVTDTQWLKRTLADAMSAKGYLRRVFKSKDDYYDINEVACVAGPYAEVGRAKLTLTIISRNLSKSTGIGFMSQQDGTLFVTRDFFIGEIWPKLSNTSGYQKIADVVHAHRQTLGSGVLFGSPLVERTLLECRERIAQLPEGFEKMELIRHRDEIDRKLTEMDFLYEISTTESNEGLVYMVTSDILDAVKIGKWSGTPEQLRYRYITYYGETCSIISTPVANRATAEKSLHIQFSRYNIRRPSSAGLKGELFEKQHVESYKQAIENLKKESFQTVIADFEKLLHDRVVLGYHTTKATFYELNTLCEAVYTTLTDQQIKNKWRSSLSVYRAELQSKKILYENKGVRYVTVAHFLMYCLKLGSEYNIARGWTERMQSVLTTTGINVLELEHPSLDYQLEESNDILVPLEGDVFSAQTVAQHVTNTLWLKRNLAKEMIRKEYPRRVYNGKDDYYNLNELTVIAGPYGDLTKAKTALCTISPALKHSRIAGLGFLAQPDGTIFVTRDFFIGEVWPKLSNASGHQKIADAFSEGSKRAAHGVRNPSSLIASVIEENTRNIYAEGTAQEVQDYGEQVEQLEDNFANENLPADNPLRNVRTVVNQDSIIPEIVLTRAEIMELKKHQIDAIQGTEKHRITVHEEQETARLCITEETERIREKTKEAAEKAKEAAARAQEVQARQDTLRTREEARIANANARLAEADPVARIAAANADQAEAEARKAQAEERREILQREREAELVRKCFGKGISRPAAAKRQKRVIPKNKEKEDAAAFVPKVFPPPVYSETYTRPRRGRGQTALADS